MIDFADIISPAGLVSLLFACALASLIPALVLKVLMGTVFFRQVSYLLVLLALIVSYFFSTAAYASFGLLTDVAMETMPPLQSGLILVAGLIFQVMCLKFIAPGPRMEWIEAWKWLVVIILQYVVYILLALLYAFVVGVPAEAAVAANL
ncbi:MAG: hypothetical protein NWQ23_11865 [Yoonia sp.]|uniref:hypothetical protein n=1 Tax=Yoonia sp. TaxID=2212373 RepID=UPI00273E12B7|nr:hypothetical protein [Yoonia sp.]MDP5086109.1 hypothetical protein [Yoonia sp.]